MSKSKSWSEVMSSWLPKWPKRNRDTGNITGLDSEVQFNKVPQKFKRPTSVVSAPAEFERRG